MRPAFAPVALYRTQYALFPSGACRSGSFRSVVFPAPICPAKIRASAFGSANHSRRRGPPQDARQHEADRSPLRTPARHRRRDSRRATTLHDERLRCRRMFSAASGHRVFGRLTPFRPKCNRRAQRLFRRRGYSDSARSSTASPTTSASPMSKIGSISSRALRLQASAS